MGTTDRYISTESGWLPPLSARGRVGDELYLLEQQVALDIHIRFYGKF